MKQLYLSTTNRRLSGVCGGLGEYFDVDPTVIRLAWVVGTILTGLFPGVVAYVLAVIVIPHDPREAQIVTKKKR